MSCKVLGTLKEVGNTYWFLRFLYCPAEQPDKVMLSSQTWVQIPDRRDVGRDARQIEVHFCLPHLQNNISGNDTKNTVPCTLCKEGLPKWSVTFKVGEKRYGEKVWWGRKKRLMILDRVWTSKQKEGTSKRHNLVISLLVQPRNLQHLKKFNEDKVPLQSLACPSTAGICGNRPWLKILKLQSCTPEAEPFRKKYCMGYMAVLCTHATWPL